MNAFERVRVKERDARACPLDSPTGEEFRQMFSRVALPYVFHSSITRVFQHQGTRWASEPFA